MFTFTFFKNANIASQVKRKKKTMPAAVVFHVLLRLLNCKG